MRSLTTLVLIALALTLVLTSKGRAQQRRFHIDSNLRVVVTQTSPTELLVVLIDKAQREFAHCDILYRPAPDGGDALEAEIETAFQPCTKGPDGFQAVLNLDAECPYRIWVVARAPDGKTHRSRSQEKTLRPILAEDDIESRGD